MIHLKLSLKEQAALEHALPEPGTRLHLCWVESKQELAFEYFNVAELVNELEHTARELGLDRYGMGHALAALAHKVSTFDRSRQPCPLLKIIDENRCTACGHTVLSHKRKHDNFGEGPYACLECDCEDWTR